MVWFLFLLHLYHEIFRLILLLTLILDQLAFTFAKLGCLGLVLDKLNFGLGSLQNLPLL